MNLNNELNLLPDMTEQCQEEIMECLGDMYRNVLYILEDSSDYVKNKFNEAVEHG
jgi:hypothetical protein